MQDMLRAVWMTPRPVASGALRPRRARHRGDGLRLVAVAVCVLAVHAADARRRGGGQDAQRVACEGDGEPQEQQRMYLQHRDLSWVTRAHKGDEPKQIQRARARGISR